MKNWIEKNSKQIIEESAKIEGVTPQEFMIKLGESSCNETIKTEESNRLGKLMKKVGMEMLEKQIAEHGLADYLDENPC